MDSATVQFMFLVALQTTKKAVLEALFFSVHEVWAFWLLFIKPYVCEAACLKSIYSTLCFWMCLMLESMNAEECKYWLIDQKKKNHSRTQSGLSFPFDQHELTYCKMPNTVETLTCTQICICANADLVHRKQESAVKFVLHLGTHEKGNGSRWSDEWDQSVSSSELSIKVKHCLLGPITLSKPCHARP